MVKALILVIILQGCSPCIVDMYYAADLNEKYKKALSGSEKKCYYTINECDYDCPAEFIKREHYDFWAKKYTDLGLKPPHPKRTDKEELYVSFY